MINEEYKIWIAVRKDLDMPMGKAIVQSGHALQLLTAKLLRNHLNLWQLYTENQSIVKICVKVKNKEHLLNIEETCNSHRIPNQLICDAGRTIFNEPTFTICAFGPWRRSTLPSELKRLQLYGD